MSIFSPTLCIGASGGITLHNIEKNPKEWKEFIEAPDNPDEMEGIREKTRIGRPLGPNDFIERLEGQLKRVFKLKPQGRPKKKVDK